MELIQTVTVGSGGQTSIVFTSIAADWTDLYLVTSLRTTVSGIGDYAVISFNGVTTGFTSRVLYGTGSGRGSAAWSGTDGKIAAQAVGNTATSNTFSSSSLYIPNYTSNVNKSFSADATRENNATASESFILGGLWSNTAAIASITLDVYSGTLFAEYSSASLYGILAGSDGTTTVS